MSNPRAFQTIGLIGRHSDPSVAESLRGLAVHLALRERQIVIDGSAAALAPQAIHLSEQELAARAELLIAVGGDGTMLHAARLASAADVPLLGVNRGRLGFLADIGPAEMCDRLDDVLAGRFERETRTMLNAHVLRADNSTLENVALNDVVVQKWETGRILEFETWIDGRYVNTHRGDGLIVATSTGSTAYALSCGGPILHPQLEALVLAPICPHTLSDRPIVVHSRSRVEVRLVQRPNTKAQITCDGVMLGDLTAQDRLSITPAAKQVTLLHPPGHDYYRILRSKLHWGRGEKTHER
ncbi:MAG: NAD(+) kinase [Candidatus Obscuribacterales bacterium]|nr:NAD(+) kinase [Steroidobacteraceae bacterium]